MEVKKSFRLSVAIPNSVVSLTYCGDKRQFLFSFNDVSVMGDFGSSGSSKSL